MFFDILCCYGQEKQKAERKIHEFYRLKMINIHSVSRENEKSKINCHHVSSSLNKQKHIERNKIINQKTKAKNWLKIVQVWPELNDIFTTTNHH